MAQVPASHPTWPFTDWRPRAVLFDWDGTLVDTEPCWTRAQTIVLERRGIAFHGGHKELLIGHPITEMGRLVGALVGAPGPQIATELTELVAEFVSAGVQPQPGAPELVTMVAEAVPTAVVSNSRRMLLDLMLAGSGLAELFAFSLSGDDVANPKPAPDSYRLACRRLAVPCADALAVEDTRLGARAARAAGIPTLGVPTLGREDFPADALVGSLHDPDLVRWVSAWEGRGPDERLEPSSDTESRVAV